MKPHQRKELEERLEQLLNEYKLLEEKINQLKTINGFDKSSLCLIERKQKNVNEMIQKVKSLLLGDIIA